MARLVALVAAAVLVLPGCGGGSSSAPSAAPAPEVVPGHVRCPDPSAAAETVVDHGSDALPTGASAARLCLRDNHTAWFVPREDLTTGLDDLVAVVNRQRIHDQSSAVGCGGVGAPAWSLVLRYDGGIRRITGDNGGCWDLLVGSTQRFGSRVVYDAYLHALLDQRHASGPPRTTYPVPACPDPARTDAAFSPVADAAQLTAGQICPTAGSRGGRAIALRPAGLRTLRHDVATAFPARQVRDLDDACFQGGRPLEGAVVGVDAWGDPVSVLVACDRYRVVRPGSDRYGFARMLPSTERMLRQALGG
jgi:hypothetical protein